MSYSHHEQVMFCVSPRLLAQRTRPLIIVPADKPGHAIHYQRLRYELTRCACFHASGSPNICRTVTTNSSRSNGFSIALSWRFLISGTLVSIRAPVHLARLRGRRYRSRVLYNSESSVFTLLSTRE